MSGLEVVEISDNDLVEEPDVYELVESGSRGPAGPGLSAGGLIGQIVQKTSSVLDYATEWVTLTKAMVGLGNVTDDSQLKRSAGDFQAFTQKINPVLTDSILGEDSADGENKKRITLDSIKTLFQTAFSLVYAAIFNTLKLNTITGPVTINPVTASTYTGDFSANFTATFTGFTASRKSVLIHLEKSGITLRTVTIAGYNFHFMTDLDLTDMVDGTYQIVANNPNTDTEVYLYVTLAP